jgi:hypothetical protein
MTLQGCWVIVYSCYPSWADPGPGLLGFQQNPPKTIGPPGKPEGNTIRNGALRSLTRDSSYGWLQCSCDCSFGNEWGSMIKLCSLHVLL